MSAGVAGPRPAGGPGPGGGVGAPASPPSSSASVYEISTGTNCSAGPLTGQSSPNSRTGGTSPVTTGPTDTCTVPTCAPPPSSAPRATSRGPGGVLGAAAGAIVGRGSAGCCAPGCASASAKPHPDRVSTTPRATTAATVLLRTTRISSAVADESVPFAGREGKPPDL